MFSGIHLNCIVHNALLKIVCKFQMCKMPLSYNCDALYEGSSPGYSLVACEVSCLGQASGPK